MRTKQDLSNLLKKTTAMTSSVDHKKMIEKLQLSMLRVQQAVWHKKERVIIVFEGFDASGKGGTIRRLTEVLDPRGVRVHAIAEPSKEEQGKHWLWRFWNKLPSPGTIAVFDRSWYGRVLVERVDKLTEKENWKRAYDEINQFEKNLTDDGIIIIKFFLSISKDEQLKRFEARLNDPYKGWKINSSDVKARKNWDEYVGAVDEMLYLTESSVKWNLIQANDKQKTRYECLKIVTDQLKAQSSWMEKIASKKENIDIKKALKELV